MIKYSDKESLEVFNYSQKNSAPNISTGFDSAREKYYKIKEENEKKAKLQESTKKVEDNEIKGNNQNIQDGIKKRNETIIKQNELFREEEDKKKRKNNRKTKTNSSTRERRKRKTQVYGFYSIVTR